MITFNQTHELFEKQTALLAHFQDFEQKIKQLSEAMHLRLDSYEIDHLALRVNSVENAKYWLTLLLKYGTILSDNVVNGRVIYLIKLHQPLYFVGQFVEIIELPFPKNNQYYPLESWEHIEVVIPFLSNESVENWVERVNQLFLWNQRENLKVKVSEPKVDGEQLPNPSIAVSFVDKTQNHTCIKVHPYHIKTIIEV
ncbi:VOC family protein [Pasteurella sp. PK-2025]|uniref:VOC family protein n=1 Tax=Pasteurella sp. PK-2025 TaxID=3413133 RepID=UPI003C737FFB